MAGYSLSTVVEEFAVPEGYEVIVAVAFGYPGEGEYLGEKHKALENVPQIRKKYDEVIIMNEWNL